MTLQEALKQYDSIRLYQTASTWEDAIRKSVEPLIEAGAVTSQYYDLIVESTNKLGSYYILCPGMAMPHAQPGEYVMKNAFSFITLDKPVTFPDGSEVNVLVCMAATCSDNNLSDALAQIIAVFSADNIMEKIYSCQSRESILQLINDIV